MNIFIFYTLIGTVIILLCLWLYKIQKKRHLARENILKNLVDSEKVPKYKLYSTGQITLACFLGMPLAGSILMALNYKALGKTESMKKILLIGVVSTAVVVIISLLLRNTKISPYALPAGYIAGMWQYAKQKQGDCFESHIKQGGAEQSSWFAAGIGLGTLAAVVAIYLMGFFIYTLAFNK